jgi:hypothetical protein
MAERAHVTSSDAIEAFRAAIIGYLSKTRPVLEDAIDDVQRTRQWLQHDRRMHWENQLRRRRKVLEEAEQAVFSARIANLREVSSAENAAVLRAKRAVTEAEDKLRIVKRWSNEFDNRVEPLVKQLEQLRTLLANSMPKAALHLAQVIKALDAYAGVSPIAAPPPAPAEPKETQG